MIYVDNPHKKFKVRRSGLDASPLLSKLLTHHPENGWYIMSPMLSALDADAFRPVGEYIDRREYHPNILDDGTAHVRLEGDLTPAMLHYQVLRCGTVYHVAHTLAMPGLQDLAFRKLRALAPHYQPLEILTVVELLFDIGTREMRHYLTQHVAENYWSIVLAETKKMADVMVANAALARAVFGKMSGKGDGEMKEDEDEDKDKDVKGEEEGKEGPKVEGLLSQKPKKEQVDRTNDGAKGHDARKEGGIVQEDKDDAGTQPGKKEKTDEAVTQTEEEMVRMALRRSDEEQTEEDWVQLVQRQSDLFEAF